MTAEFKVEWVWPNGEMGQGCIRVQGPETRMYVWEVWDNALVYASRPKSTVDVRQLLTREEWDGERGGYCSWDELTKLLDNATM